MARARVRFIVEYPFLGSILLQTKVKYRQCIDHMGNRTVAATDGESLYLDVEAMAKERWNVSAITALIAHELWHIALLHPFRLQKRQPEVFNIAADAVVNAMIEESSPELWKSLKPFDPVDMNEYSGMNVERVYDDLMKKLNQDNQPSTPSPNSQGNGPALPRGVLIQPTGTPEQVRQKLKQTEQKVRKALQSAKMAGKDSSSLQRFFDEYLGEHIPWYELLRPFMNQLSESLTRWSWKSPNKRFIQSGVYFPHRKRERKVKVVIAFDTSGSMTPQEVAIAAREISNLLSDVHAEAVVLHTDASVQKVERFSSSDLPIHLSPVGGGGTRFTPAFQWVSDHNEEIDAFIYLTDLQSRDYPDEPPPYPVIWITTAEKDSREVERVPFGTILHIDPEATDQ